MPVVVRRTRELLVAGTTLSIAAAAHLLAGGSLPGAPLAWFVVLALTAPLAVWTARRRLTLRRLLPAMVALQLVQHTALSVLGAAGDGSATAIVLSGHAGHALGPGSLSPATGTTLHLHHADDPRTTTWMLAAHAAAVVLTALLLAAGDRAAANVASHLRHVAVLVLGPPAPLVVREPGVVVGRAWRPHPWRSRRSTPPRGPPLLPGALARAA
ncbi:hypothetical protein [Krasilnikoviella flava]|uniref:Uncharacterized protein n=1 Tax=Krasilnikoviella flava TaxID=526729 RepID=A0A1T5L5U1_9MICO|nr:hypothetical protein [Krasilnikoviella flava]SKC70979.1 hypothetical protein SAMN04324258_2862 [Krasilnikoviella flava]